MRNLKYFENFTLLQYFKNIWSKDDQIKFKILNDEYLLNKYSKYYDKDFNWNVLSNEDLKKIFDEWNKDSNDN